MDSRKLGFFVAILLTALSGCGTSRDGSTALTEFGATCGQQQSGLASILKKARSCTADADCGAGKILTADMCGLTGCNGVPVSGSYGASKIASLESYLEAFHSSCTPKLLCACSPFNGAACIAGKCQGTYAP